MTTNIIIAGPRGKMGSEAIKMIVKEQDFNLVACIDDKNSGMKLSDLDDQPSLDIPIYDGPKECFEDIKADVFLDLTIPEVGYKHTKLALENNLKTVIGTSGFSNTQLKELTDLAEKNKVGCIIAPNFAIGAVLMMQFSKQAAKYFPDVEIIEKHHDQKLDAPSGTALKTVDLINEVRKEKQQGAKDEKETILGVRGGTINGIHIHSMRLPGLVAHQEVVFGGSGQTLTIKHDSFSRESFMAGVKLSIESVMKLNELVYGLENILK